MAIFSCWSTPSQDQKEALVRTWTSLLGNMLHIICASLRACATGLRCVPKLTDSPTSINPSGTSLSFLVIMKWMLDMPRLAVAGTPLYKATWKYCYWRNISEIWKLWSRWLWSSLRQWKEPMSLFSCSHQSRATMTLCTSFHSIFDGDGKSVWQQWEKQNKGVLCAVQVQCGWYRRCHHACTNGHAGTTNKLK